MTPNRTRAEIEDDICEIMIKHGLDRHVDGYMQLTDYVLKKIDEADKAAYERGQRDALLAKDLDIAGSAHMMDGKRVDPKDIYLDPESFQKGTLAGLEMAAGIAKNYWAHIPQEEFDDGFEIPKKDSPDFVHEDIAKQIRAKAKELRANELT